VVASTDERDRYGDRILVDGVLNGRRFGDGWQTDAFERNPVFLAFHEHRQAPLGTVERIWRETQSPVKRLLADVRFAQSNPLADVVLGLFRERAMRSVSVGFMPKRERIYEPKSAAERAALGLGPGGLIFGEAELLELSAVSIPANPSALAVNEARAWAQLADAAQAEGLSETAYMIRSVLPSRRVTVDPAESLTRCIELTRALVAEPGAGVERAFARLIATTRELIDDQENDPYNETD
jgi:hypothetical protein